MGFARAELILPRCHRNPSSYDSYNFNKGLTCSGDQVDDFVAGGIALLGMDTKIPNVRQPLQMTPHGKIYHRMLF